MVARAENRSGLRDFIAFLATVRGDLSNVTAPPFILAPQSLVEFPSYWGEHPSLFAAPALEADAGRRALLVLKLYLCALKQQYYVGRPVKEGIKKPLNSFLGELFVASWSDGTTTTKLVSEQVTHHPPTTACYLSDDSNGVRATGYSTQATTLSGTSVLVRQSGHALLHIDAFNEDHLLPLPDIRVRGFLSGVPYPELGGTYKIVSSSGFTSEITFSGRGFIFGSRNAFEAAIYRTDDPSERQIYTANGIWSDEFSFYDADGQLVDKYDVKAAVPAPMELPELAHQDPWESRKAWAEVIDALNKGDVAAVLSEKSKLENAQRAMRRKEKAEGKQWEPAFFTKGDDKAEIIFEQLSAFAGNDGEARRLLGRGLWSYDRTKAEGKERGSFRTSVGPMG